MIEYIILGIFQGLTEFLPVSSSGHLVVLQKIMGITSGQMANSVILHLGTLVALLIFFFKDIARSLRSPKTILLIVIVTVITGAIGILGRDFFEELFSLPKFVALGWIITGFTLILVRKFMSAKRDKVSLKDAFVLGAMQGIAIIPGISRSGITISTLLFRGLDRETSFHFSFLASIPAIFGAALLESKKIDFAFKLAPRDLLAGFLSSLFVGLLSLWILHMLLRKGKFHYFGYYCLAIALLTLIFIK